MPLLPQLELVRAEPHDDSVAVVVHLHRAPLDPAEAAVRTSRQIDLHPVAPGLTHEERALRPALVTPTKSQHRLLRARRAIHRDAPHAHVHDAARPVRPPRQRVLSPQRLRLRRLPVRLRSRARASSPSRERPAPWCGFAARASFCAVAVGRARSCDFAPGRTMAGAAGAAGGQDRNQQDPSVTDRMHCASP